MASGRWESSDRLARLPADWQKIRKRILRRDGYMCRHIDGDGIGCISRANQVDHIVRNDDDSDLNLQALCEYHHRQKSASEGGQAYAAKQAARFRTPEPHPGRL